MVIEVQFTDWSGAGRIRHPVYLGTRQDKSATEVVRDVADPGSERVVFKSRRSTGPSVTSRKGWHGAVPPPRRPQEIGVATAAKVSFGSVVVAHAPRRATAEVSGVQISHPDRQLWPGISKKELAEYWQAIADVALPGIAHARIALPRRHQRQRTILPEERARHRTRSCAALLAVVLACALPTAASAQLHSRAGPTARLSVRGSPGPLVG